MCYLKIMFMGTPEFSISTLEALKDGGYNVETIITQPDKPKNRGQKMTHPPVYDYAVENNIKVFQPENLKKENFEEILINSNPDIIIVTAYGKILPEYILNYPKYGCINVHASLLPKYRGAAPIQWSIINGENKTGITIMYMEKGLDTGDMILKKEVDILSCDTYETLHNKLAFEGKSAIIDALKLIELGNVNAQKQDDACSSYAHMITKETAKIDWTKSNDEIYNLVRGLYPFPKAMTFYNGKILKIIKTEQCLEKTDECAGKIIKTDKDSIFVSCGNKTVIKIKQIQLEGKKSMSVKDFLVGNEIQTGIVLGK